MKTRKLFLLPAVCCALALTLGACGEGKQKNAKAKAEAKAETDAEALRDAADKAGLILSEDATTITGVKDKGIKSVVIPNGVTSIGNSAFSGCSSLTSITIPDSVTSIGEMAFYNCSSLKSITIPDSVTSIGNYAFFGCDSLTSLTIPDSVTGIGKNAFNLNSSCRIKTVSYSPAFETLPDGILINKKHKALVRAPENLSGGYTIPTGVTSIGAYAFSFCSNLTSITIPDSVTSIGDSAFSFCSNLTSVTIPDKVTSIGKGAFRGVQSVQVSTKNPVFSVDGSGVLINNKEKKLLYAPPGLSGNYTIPDSVTSIGEWAFSGYKSLTSVTIPDSVTSIGEMAFYDCSSLTSLTIPSSVTSIGEMAFFGVKSVQVSTQNPVFSVDGSGVLINKKEKKLLYVPANVSGHYTIPDSVTSIGKLAFSGCKSLTSVTIPSSVTSIGDNAFSDCKNLTSITIPSSVTSIGDSAFWDCDNLTSVTIPDKVTSIGNGAFRGVQSVQVSTKNPVFSVDGSGVLINNKEKKLLYAPANVSGHYTIPSSVTSIGDGAFWGCSNLTRITIPDSVTSIGDSAFWDCDNLTSVTIGNGVTSIGEWAFEGCSSLRSVTIPTSVTSIGEMAFSDCSSLKRLTIPAKFTDEDVKEWNLSYRCIIIRR